ncbi:hypothetical protein D3C78_1865340 [compost metagenome]
MVKPVSIEDSKYIEKFWVEAELTRARDELEKVQDSDPQAIGSVSSWRDYRKALRAWQDNVNFPDSSKRPTAPDSI